MNFRVTTPTVFGGWIDPEFSMTADVMAEATITAPMSVSGAFTVGPMRIVISGVRLDSHNVTGDIAMAVTEAYRAFTGNDLTAQLTQARTLNLNGFEVGLSDLNPAVRRIPAQSRLEYTVAAGHQFRVNGTARPLAAPSAIH
jgi:hypothetical protein